MNAVQGARRREPGRWAGEENLYVVAYDIAAPRRWRKVFRIMEGYGEWLQLSVFQCRLSRRRSNWRWKRSSTTPRTMSSSSISGSPQRSGRASKAWVSPFLWSIAAR
jgi:hypothetical protein